MAPTTAAAPTREDLDAALALVLDNSINLTGAAAQSGCAYTTLRRHVAEGDVPAFRLGRDMFMWRLDIPAPAQ